MIGRFFADPARRAWVYAILIAGGGLLVTYGVFTEERAQVWADFVAAVLMIGGGTLARANLTPPADD